jgi:hypothetical protein
LLVRHEVDPPIERDLRGEFRRGRDVRSRPVEVTATCQEGGEGEVAQRRDRAVGVAALSFQARRAFENFGRERTIAGALLVDPFVEWFDVEANALQQVTLREFERHGAGDLHATLLNSAKCQHRDAVHHGGRHGITARAILAVASLVGTARCVGAMSRW